MAKDSLTKKNMIVSHRSRAAHQLDYTFILLLGRLDLVINAVNKTAQHAMRSTIGKTISKLHLCGVSQRKCENMKK